MSDTPARLLKMLSLLQAPRDWPGSELATRLDVSGRTIRRDVERLRDLGYPVEAAMGAIGGYRLVGGTAMPPLLLDDEEAVAIAIGLRTVVAHAIDGVEEASVRALVKLQQVLPPRLRTRVGALSVATVTLVGDAATLDPEELTLIAKVIANRGLLRFDYRANDRTESSRLVEPHSLVAAGRRWYLVAFDNDRDDWRIFRADRVRDPRQVAGRAEARELPAQDAAAFVRTRLYDLAPTYEAVATLQSSAEQVRLRLGDASGDLEPIDEHHCRVRLQADTLEWLAFRLALFDCEFEVHEPPELVAYLRALGGRITRAAGTNMAQGSGSGHG
jgi:predicted DNA-binding transcriptional regulator YafY